MNTRIILAASAALALAGAAFADSHEHQGHSAAMDPAAAAASPSTAAFEAANAVMMSDMDMALSGDTNVDFARSMIPHHKGAIAMAQVMLEYGDAPALRDLADEIIAAQEAEIAVLEQWLAENAH